MSPSLGFATQRRPERHAAGLDPHRFILTLGCQRSGTTLVHLIFSAHPGVAGLDEPLSYEYLRGRKRRDRRVGTAPRVTLKLPQMGYTPGGGNLSALLVGGA